MSTDTAASVAARPMGAGGRRLSAAFDAVSSLPALAEARERVIALAEQQAPSTGDVADAIETDTGIAIAVMQAANNGAGPRGRTGGVLEAVESLRSGRIVAIAARMETYDMLGPRSSGSDRFERLRRHGIAVRSAAGRVADLARMPNHDELSVAAMFHDVGRLVIGELYGHEHAIGPTPEEAPDDLIRRERRELGIDHALVGAVLIRRWGLPGAIASAVERHHSPDADGMAGAIRLADLVVHHASGHRVAPDTLREAAGRIGVDENGVRRLLFAYPASGEPRRRASEPCPLSVREIDALRGLAEGKVYKQIAQELSLSVSTVRTHLHNVYKKIDAVDRAQAVLIARDRNWI